MLNAYAVLAKALTACSHFNVEFVTFLDALPSVTAYKLLAFLDLLALASLYFVKDQVSVIGYNERTIGHFIDKFRNITIGHFEICLMRTRYSLKP